MAIWAAPEASRLSGQRTAATHLKTAIFRPNTFGIAIGLTFSGLALRGGDPETTALTTANARKAYDSARRMAEGLEVDRANSEEITEKFERLKTQLAKLEKRQP
jgi:hypothetical protein